MMFSSRTDQFLGKTTITCLLRLLNLNLKGTSDTIYLVHFSVSQLMRIFRPIG